jgi:polyisoprenoid-binding protein YceI
MSTETATASATSPVVRTFTVDKSHSEATFQVRHLVTKVRGRFTDLSGAIEYDTAQPEHSRVALSIVAASIDTGAPDRDAHLRSDDFFGVGQFPSITFTGTGISKTGEAEYDVRGTLTIHGIARDVTLPVSFLGAAKDPWGNDRLGFETEITINRKDFGLLWNAALETGGFLVGDDVKISVSIQAIGG